MKWVYGITTVPERFDSLLPRTLASLKAGGFFAPYLFIDGAGDTEFSDVHPRDYWLDFPDLRVIHRSPRIKAYGNWVLGLLEMYIRHPYCDRYAMFEDDLVTYPNLMKYLEQCELKEKTYWNLHTLSSNEAILPATQGFYPSNQLGRSAVGLVFTRQGVIDLLSSHHTMERPCVVDPKGANWKRLDGVIITALKEKGYTELVHNPSLTQHTGTVSVLNASIPLPSKTFLGEEYDARRFYNGMDN